MTSCFLPRMTKSCLKWDLILKVRICSDRSKFFPLRVDPCKKGANVKVTETHLLSQSCPISESNGQ